ncbi:unnamed protein product [Ambrosiozyma monospora]|uniref:Unnamed protein product n=1 Tax=Ambrosiozyma monospora TaxID=43982 RepID=A0ACB5TG03_AMBMO|nr:unnamed protein product [Ambrosiozyma monospora]
MITRKEHTILAEIIAETVKNVFQRQLSAQNDGLTEFPAELRSYRYNDKCLPGGDPNRDVINDNLFTEVVLSYVNSLNNPTVLDLNYDGLSRGLGGWSNLVGPERTYNSTLIDWKILSGLKAPLVVNDLVFYPQVSFNKCDAGDDFKLEEWCYLEI